MKKMLISITLILVLSAAGYTWRKGQARPAAPEETVVVQRGDVVSRATETGSLEPVNVVAIKSEQAGEIKKIYVRAGDIVVAGQPLATLQQESGQARQIAEARAAIEQERLNVLEAERDLARMQALFEKGFVARIEWEAAEKRAQNANIKHDLAQRQLLLTLGGNKSLYEKYLRRTLASREADDFTLHAPTSGTVIEVAVAEGEIVSSGTSAVSGGTTLMRISDLSNMWVKTKINEVNVGQLKEGQTAEIRLDAVPDRHYTGTVEKISPRGEKENNIVTYEVTLKMAHADTQLMPSMTANVDILTGVVNGALFLPRSAITQTNGTPQVTLPGGEKRAVRLGLANDTVVVIAEGLSEGDAVVIPRAAPEEDTSNR